MAIVYFLGFMLIVGLVVLGFMLNELRKLHKVSEKPSKA